ncbi:MAG: vWA domain-containing protein [Pirellulales bacterium]
MKAIDALRRWWQGWAGEDETPLDGDTPAWLLSLAFHLVLLVALAFAWHQRTEAEVDLTITTLNTQEPEATPEEFEYSNDPQVEIGSNSLAGSRAALAMAPTLNEVSQLRRENEPTELASVVEPLLLDLSTAPTINERMLVKGAAGIGATGAMGAVDRITQEIATSLEQRRTLVVWILDQSLSMEPQRKAIAARLDRIYQELGVVGATAAADGEAPLLSAVVAFGEQVTFRTPKPTADMAEVTKAVERIENDPSGTEMVFSAVAMAAKKYQSYAAQSPRRNVMIVVFSDEVGDDEQQLDVALAVCRRHAMPVYCVGIPAPFGRREVEVRYVDPDPNYDQSPQWLPVRQGPESLLPEGVQLGFAGARNQDLDRIASGFGPFALTRLCYETGGIYFMVRPNRDGGETPVMIPRYDHFFDPSIMRRYQPEYFSVEEYKKRLQRNRARAALVEAATMSLVNPMENPRLDFPRTDEAALKRSLDDAQRLAAKIGPKLDALYLVLKQGEADRSKLAEPRWRAGYDLAMGRVLAVKARTESYNAMLAKAKNGLKFEKPGSDTHVLVPADEISVGSALEKLAKQGREYLERVRVEHAGTPWALLADRELKEPIGWKWSERVSNPPRQRMAASGNGNPAPPADQLRRLEKPKPRRPNVRL